MARAEAELVCRAAKTVGAGEVCGDFRPWEPLCWDLMTFRKWTQVAGWALAEESVARARGSEITRWHQEREDPQGFGLGHWRVRGGAVYGHPWGSLGRAGEMEL